ncbi:MAG: hypothetical protein ABIS29_02890, partial [Vicinamibacterales bacterium]
MIEWFTQTDDILVSPGARASAKARASANTRASAKARAAVAVLSFAVVVAIGAAAARAGSCRVLVALGSVDIEPSPAGMSIRIAGNWEFDNLV